MQNSFNKSKTSKSYLQTNLSCSNQINSRKNISTSMVQKFPSYNNNSLNNSKAKLNSTSNSKKKRFYSKKNIFLSKPSNNESESKYINKNNGKDILLNKIKKLKRRNKNINNFFTSFNSVKIFKKKDFSNFLSRRRSYEKPIKKNNCSGLGSNITMNRGYKYISNYGKELLKKK